MKDRLITIGLVLGVAFLGINLVRSFIAINEKRQILTDSEKRLINEQEKEEKLKRKLAQVKSYQYVEMEARDKLNLSAEGEYVVILPPITPVVTPTPTAVLSPIEQWVRVFW